MKAVILAAGEGRRLEPVTNRRPKPMVPVGNQPLLEYVVDAVAGAGVDEIVLVVGYKRDRIQTYFGDGDDWDVTIEYALQQKQLGTGHAVLQAEDLVDDDFIVLNGDRIIQSDVVAELVAAHREKPGAVMAVTRSEEPSEYGVVSIEGDRVTGIAEKPRAGEARSNLINAGVYGFGESIFDRIRATDTAPDGELTITATIASLIRDGAVRAVKYRGLWVDVSHLWDVLSVNANVLDREPARTYPDRAVEAGAQVSQAVRVGADTRVGANATVRRGTALGDNVVVGANAVVSNAVVFPDAVIGEGAVVKDAVVAGNARVGPNATVPGGPADVLVDGHLHEEVPLGAVVGDNTRVGGGVVLTPGTVLGDDVRVADGATVTGRVEPGTSVRNG